MSNTKKEFAFAADDDAMLIIDTITFDDAERHGFETTRDCALHAEWTMEMCRSLFSLYKAKQVAGEHIALDSDKCARAATFVDWRRELVYKSLSALKEPKPVESVSGG